MWGDDEDDEILQRVKEVSLRYDDDDDDDEILKRVKEESLRLYQEEEILRQSQRDPSPLTIRNDDPCPGTSSDIQPCTSQGFKKPSWRPPPHALQTLHTQDSRDDELYDGPEAEGFSFKAGQFYIYPTSDKFPVRTYQRDIVEKALFNNTLVCLPTGLGKTFIAAVVMYNYYMWYPKGKIIFMAPTKPLVAQQIENCINIMGIPASDTAEMTGATHSKVRAVTWKEKRVFFLTPQCVQNDLSSNVCPANAVKCVVIDEAHRALGDHAYSQVIRLLNSYDACFRVLALSATPGSDLEAVQKVVSNLMINHIELRSEESNDIVQYTHQRNVELMVVDVGPTISRIKARYVAIGSDFASRLHQKKVLFGNFGTMPKFSVLKEWESFRRERSVGMDPMAANQISNDFAIVHSLSHGLELLQTYGLRLLLNHLKGLIDKNDSTGRRLAVNEDLRSLMEDIETHLHPVEIDEENSKNGKSKKFIYGHPKLDRLQEVIISHFESFEKKGSATRAIVFCEYREGVIEICDMLKNFEPLVKPVVFMGQSTAKNSKGISQKQQLEIMDKFKKGIYNTLISTSVGEEGLDIGEVDLIICFDAKNSPIRQVQRMGRTGRKREGRIIMLVTKGKEEKKYVEGLHKKRNVKDVLLNRENLAGHLYEECPRMLPPGILPKYEERPVVQSANKPKSNQQDLRKMFAKRLAGNSSGSSKSSPTCRQLGKVPYLCEGDLDDLKLMWNVPECCKFDKIPKGIELWSKRPEELGRFDILSENIDLSNYVEFVRCPQRTHVVGNSSESVLLSELLLWSEDRREKEQDSICGGLSSQVTSSQIWPTKQIKKRGRPVALGPKASNPSKRGRPRKNSSNSNSPAREQIIPEAAQPIKPCRPQFIEDDEELSSYRSDLPQESKPSSSVCLPSSSACFLPPPKAVASCQKIKSASTPEDSIITLESDDEDDLNCSSSSGFAYLTSEPTQQELYADLSRALRNQSFEEIDDCIVCDNLFPCHSLNQLIMHKRKKVKDLTWKAILSAMENVMKFLPDLTNEMITGHSVRNCKSEILSQGIFSLMPKHENGLDDEITGGFMCGGVGDLSPPAILPSPRKSFDSFQSKFQSSPGKVHNLQPDLFESIDKSLCVKNKSVPASQPEQSELLPVEDGFEKLGFDFLSLSKVVDIFNATQQNQGTAKTQAHKEDTETDFAMVSPVEPQKLNSKKGFDFLGLSKIHHISDVPQQMSDNAEAKNVTSPISSHEILSKQNSVINEASSSKQRQTSCSDFSSPPRIDTEIERPVSPILCSQASKKPRSGLRISKQSVRGEKSDFSPPRTLSNASLSTTLKKIEVNSKMKRSMPEDEIVTSSSQVHSAQRCGSPPKLNFDLFDESFFPLSGEDNGSTSTVDESLKEAIRNKALEAKAKQPDITFTQELKEMCETSMGGLTQMLDLFESKTKSKSPILKVERADSSSSPKNCSRPTSPVVTDDEFNKAKLLDDTEDLWGSEEDLFAGCDDDISHCADSSVTASSTPAVLSINNGSSLPLYEEVCHSNLIAPTSICDMETPVSNTNGDAFVKSTLEEENIHECERSLSPVFKASQAVKKPSKLSLKKNKPPSVSSDISSTKNLPESTTETSRNILAVKSPEKVCPKQSELCAQIDFSMFGDEFNNSWLYSQNSNELEREVNKTDKNDGCIDVRQTSSKRTTFLKDENTDCSETAKAKNGSNFESHQNKELIKVSKLSEECNSSDPKKASAKAFNVCKHNSETEKNQSCQKIKENEPDNEFDIAFSKLDAAKKEQKKRMSCSTPKSNSKTTSANKRERLMNGRCALGKRQGPHEVLLCSSDEENTVVMKAVKKSLNISTFSEEDKNDFMLGVNSDLDKKRKRSALQSTSSNESLSGNKWLAAKTSKQPRKENHVRSNSKPSVEKITDVITLSSSDDEHAVLKNRKKKKSLNITSSSEESFTVNLQSEVVPNVDRKRKLRTLLSSSSNESLGGNGWLSNKTSKLPKKECSSSVQESKNNCFDLSSFCDVSLLNELEDEDEGHGDKLIQEKETSSDDGFQKRSEKKLISQGEKKRKKKTKKHTKKVNRFIVSEAEESDDHLKNSSDGESTSLDELDSSFINDSQPEASQSVVDIHAKYLQSVRSPAAAGRFKMPSRLPQMNMDVYSQYPDASEMEQTYANDSFCVDDATQYENPEMSLLEIAEAKLKAKKRGKNKSKKSLKYNAKSKLDSDDSEEEVKEQKKKKCLRRIKILEESISGDDEAASNPQIKGTGNKDEGIVMAPTRVNNSVLSHCQKENKNDSFAQLLDDDWDFDAIPEFSAFLNNVTEKIEPPKSNNTSKFVKKVPFALKENCSGLNSHSTALATGNSSTVQSVKPTVLSNAFGNPTSSSDSKGNSNFKPKTWSATSCSTSNQSKERDARPTVQIFIIASSRQVAYSPDMLRVLRINHRVHIVPRQVPDADFIVSWRLGVSRLFVSDLKDRKKIEDLVKKMKLSFTKPYLIVERDRIKMLATSNFPKKKNSKVLPPKVTDAPSSSPSPWTSVFSCNNVAFLRQAGMSLLFSQDKDETAGFLAKLATKEIKAGHGIPELAQNWSDEVDSRLKFFTSLPGINLAFALKLLAEFHTLSDFFERCSSVCDIAATLGMDVNAARKIHNLLCEVHVSP